MPTYAYRCTACSHEFEVFQKFSDAALTECPECGSPIRKVFQPVGIVFKGSGWYINDSRKPESGSTSKTSESTAKVAAESKTATPATETSSTPAPAKAAAD